MHDEAAPPLRPPLRRALLGALVYMLVGALWIAGSDHLLGLWISDPHVLSMAQTFKGGFFILLTGALLFVVLHRLFRSDAALLRRYMRQRKDVHTLNQFRESVIDNASIWINVLDADARVTVWNKAAEQISGYARDEVLYRDDVWERLYPDPAYRANVVAKVNEILAHDIEVKNLETRICCRDGQYKVMAWNSRRFVQADGKTGSIAIGRDITEHRHVLEALHARERQLAVLMANVPGMVYRCRNHADRTLEFVSSGCLELTGYTSDDLIGNRAVAYASLVHEQDRDRVREEARKATAQDQPFTLEYRIRHRDGRDVWVWEQGRPVQGEDGVRLEGIIVNITDRKRMEHRMEQMAVQDPLTGLHNRRELEAVLREAVEHAEREAQPVSLLWIDIDGFKDFNDRYGHLAGDEALRRVGHVLRDYLRSCDCGARYGGDELLAVLPGLDAASAMRVAETLQSAVQSMAIGMPDDGTRQVTVSIGVASVPDHADSVDQLKYAADQAMYRAKQTGRNRACCAVPMMLQARPDPQHGDGPAP